MSTLLVLEDESALMKHLHQMLKQHSLVEARSADEALTLFADCDEPIDLLLADVTLPASSGIQVALLLRSQIPGLPVILTSGYPVTGWSDRDSADLRRLGSISVAILQKPFQLRVLAHTVGELLSGSPQSAIARTA
jgi:two-component system cell cycle sensor histidine kinase/response regulator CckA